MIKFIRIQRYKSLNDAQFPLASLNLFSGLNGMGKSSLIQTLLLLRQSFEKNTLPAKGLLLKGDYVSVGTGQDVLAENAEVESIDFTVTWDGYEETPSEFSFAYKSKSDLQPNRTGLPSVEDDPIYQESLFTKQFQYLSADRISPQASYEVSDYYIRDLNSLGNHGEYTAHYIAEHGLNALPIAALKHPDSSSMSLLDNLDKWMAEISPGIRIHAKLQPSMNVVSLNYAFQQGSEMTADFKPQNVGFGLTFVLPVLTSILRASPGDLVIIENPEAHLHPAGQSVIGRLCSIAAQNGVQLFVETHSDHFLNGVRVAVREKVIPPNEVQVFYLERSSNSIHEALVVNPEIDEDGRIDLWPKGFFDEGDRLLGKLL
jgi:predicted ATPase